MYEIAPQSAPELPAIESLLDELFGAGRLAKASYALRRGVGPVDGLALVARHEGRVIGTVRYWPVRVGWAGAPALLLGPVGVATAWQSNGVGAALIRRSLDKAALSGHRIVVLVGDADYYARFGFSGASRYGIAMPGERPRRLLARELAAGALDGIRGELHPFTDA